MSVIAWFHVLARSDLSGLVEVVRAEATKADGPSAHDYLFDRARRQDATEDRFLWSGNVMAYLLAWLSESGIDLGTADCRAEAAALNETMPQIYVLTSADQAYLPALRAANADREQIVQYFEKIGYGFDEADEAIDDGLGLLQELIALLTDDEVLLIRIG